MRGYLGKETNWQGALLCHKNSTYEEVTVIRIKIGLPTKQYPNACEV